MTHRTIVNIAKPKTCREACGSVSPYGFVDGDVRQCEHGSMWLFGDMPGCYRWRRLSPLWTPFKYRRAVKAFMFGRALRGSALMERTTPMHGDVWQRVGAKSRLVVLHVCGWHEPPHVSGHWLSEHDGSPTCHFATYLLDRFLQAFEYEGSQLDD